MFTKRSKKKTNMFHIITKKYNKNTTNQKSIIKQSINQKWNFEDDSDEEIIKMFDKELNNQPEKLIS